MTPAHQTGGFAELICSNSLRAAGIENDTIELISKKTNVDPVLLGLYNDFGKLKLQPGQVMNIPNSNVYIIKNDDTIDSILSNTNKSALELLKANETVWFKSGTKINL
jgi:hypothetical protein